MFKGIWKTGHVWCAIKEMNCRYDSDCSDGQEQSMDDFEIESALLREMHHPNLVVCYGVVSGDILRQIPRCIVTELCLTSLDTVLHGDASEANKLSGVEICPARLLRMCMGIVAAVAYLHARKIVHRDIKAGNILLDTFKQVKICE